MPDVDVYDAIASPVRRAVLDILRDGPRPVRDIAGQFPISRPAISQHLRILLDAELVAEDRVGRERYYRLEAERLSDIDRWLSTYEEFWRDRLRNLGQLLDGQMEAQAQSADVESAGSRVTPGEASDRHLPNEEDPAEWPR